MSAAKMVSRQEEDEKPKKEEKAKKPEPDDKDNPIIIVLKDTPFRYNDW